MNIFFFFFFKQKTAYDVGTGDWSSDVCSSDLVFPVTLILRCRFYLSAVSGESRELITALSIAIAGAVAGTVGAGVGIWQALSGPSDPKVQVEMEIYNRLAVPLTDPVSYVES